MHQESGAVRGVSGQCEDLDGCTVQVQSLSVGQSACNGDPVNGIRPFWGWVLSGAVRGQIHPFQQMDLRVGKRSSAPGMIAMSVREQDGADIVVALAHPYQRGSNGLGFGVQPGIDKTEPTIPKPEEIGCAPDGPVAVIHHDDDISVSELSAVFERLDALNDEPDEEHNAEQQRSDAAEEVLEELNDSLRGWLLLTSLNDDRCPGCAGSHPPVRCHEPDKPARWVAFVPEGLTAGDGRLLLRSGTKPVALARPVRQLRVWWL